MKNDYRGRLGEQEVMISVPPTLLITAVGTLHDIGLARTSDFKSARDWIYLLGGRFGLLASEYEAIRPGHWNGNARLGESNWEEAVKTYNWIGTGAGKPSARVRSVHDVSDGGLLVAIAECMVARGFGAQIQVPESRFGHAVDPWEFCFGEGFHSFVISVSEGDGPLFEEEWKSQGIPFVKLGEVNGTEKLEVRFWQGVTESFTVPTKALRTAWKREGYWE
jgi:phosphoribosylformylglycinamidine synthase